MIAHNVQDEDTTHPFFDDIADQDAAVTPDLERKSDETEEVNIEEKEASNVKSGETEELDLETTQDTQTDCVQDTAQRKKLKRLKASTAFKIRWTNADQRRPTTKKLEVKQVEFKLGEDCWEIQKNWILETTQSTARQGTITPRTLNFEDEAGPSSPLRPIQVMESEEQLKVAEVLVAISRPRGLSIPGPIQTQPQQPTQALETTNDEEVARKIQAEWDAEEERKRFEELKKTKPKTTLRKPTSLAQERNQMMNFLKGQGYKNLQKLKYPQMKELYDKVQASIKDSFKDYHSNGFQRRKWRC
ncbi:hypothetical protein Tco_1155547 [Tanacetum coccineum]